MQDPLALAEQRLAARELRPALDALKEARAQAYDAGDRETLERVRELALELQPMLGGGRAERSCAVLLFAVHESLELLEPPPPEEEEDAPWPPLGGPRKPKPPPEPAPESEPSPPTQPEPEPERVPEPEPEPEPDPEPEPEESGPYVGRSVPARHVGEAEREALERGERLVGIFHGVVRETRDGGRRGAPRGGAALHDYLLVTDRGVVLWARGKGGAVEGYRFAEVMDAEVVRGVFARSLWIEVGGTRRWFASMKRGDAELAAELIRELAGLQPPAER